MPRLDTWNPDEEYIDYADGLVTELAGDNSIHVDETFYEFENFDWPDSTSNVARVKAMAYITSGTRMDITIDILDE